MEATPEQIVAFMLGIVRCPYCGTDFTPPKDEAPIVGSTSWKLAEAAQRIEQLTKIAQKACDETFEKQAEIDRLTETQMRLAAEAREQIEQLTTERDSAREAVVAKCRQYDADMQTLQNALNREIKTRTALEQKP